MYLNCLGWVIKMELDAYRMSARCDGGSEKASSRGREQTMEKLDLLIKCTKARLIAGKSSKR